MADADSHSFEQDVSVVGLGRVGLPLALSFADRGLRTIGIDKDADLIDTVEAGVMPFQERGTQELLERVRGQGGLRLSKRVEDAAAARHIVLTLGTPSLWHMEIDISDIRSVLDALLPVLRRGHVLVLRSTVGPGTPDFVAAERSAGSLAGALEAAFAAPEERLAAYRAAARAELAPYRPEASVARIRAEVLPALLGM